MSKNNEGDNNPSPVIAKVTENDFVTKGDFALLKDSLVREIKSLIKGSPDKEKEDPSIILVPDDTEEGESSKTIACDSCSFKTTSETQLSLHKYAVHDQSKQTKNSYKSNKNSDRIPCDACDYVGKGAIDYALHIEKHESNLQFCDQCDYRSKTNNLIQLHKESVHSENLKLKCKECDFIARSHDILKKHNKIAMGHRRNIICKHFERNNCRFGFNCKFLHKTPIANNHEFSPPWHQQGVVFVDRGHQVNMNMNNTGFYQGNGQMEGVPRPGYLLH